MNKVLYRFILVIIFSFSILPIYSEVYLGVYLTEYEYDKDNNQKAPKYGLRVHNVIKDSPASEAKLRVGDIIIEVDNQKLTDVEQLVNVLKKFDIGDSIKLKYFRNKKFYKTKLKLAERQEPELTSFEEQIATLLGQSRTFIFRYESEDDNVIGIEISPQNRDINSSGVVITEVLPDSPASKAGLQIDDVIIKVAGKDISTTDDVINEIQKAKTGNTIKIEFYRNNKKMTTQVEVVKRKSIFK